MNHADLVRSHALMAGWQLALEQRDQVFGHVTRQSWVSDSRIVTVFFHGPVAENAVRSVVCGTRNEIGWFADPVEPEAYDITDALTYLRRHSPAAYRRRAATS